MDLSPLYISLKVSLISTVITFFAGIACAGLVMKIKRGKGIIDGIFTLPMILPPTVAGFFLLIVFGKNSPIGVFFSYFNISLIFSWISAVIASTVVSFPLMYRTVRGAFEEFDADIIHAARTLGIPEFKIFWKIIIPNVSSSVIAGTILSFARALGEFGATIMIAGNIPGRTQTMAVAIYTAVQSGNRALAYKWVIIICAISFAAMLVMNFYNGYYNKRLAKKEGF